MFFYESSVIQIYFELKMIDTVQYVQSQSYCACFHSTCSTRWPNGSILRSTFLSTFQLLIFPQRMSAKNIYHHKYLPSQISRLTRRYCACVHSTCSTRWPNGSIFTQQQFFCSNFLTKIKLHSTSLDSTRLTQQGGQTARFFVEQKIE